MSEPIFPLQDTGTEPITSSNCRDGHDIEEDVSEMFSIGTLGLPAAPHQPLALNVDQASLHDDRRVQGLQGPPEVRISVTGDAFGPCAAILHRLAKDHQVSRSFGHIVLPMKNGLALCV
jgi:hypothetical protein